MRNDKATFWRGTAGIGVDLVDFQKKGAVEDIIYSMSHTSRFGMMKTALTREEGWPVPYDRNIIQDTVNKILSGEGFSGNAFEAIHYNFIITNVTRVTTHQLVRARVGVTFSQLSSREKSISHYSIRVPETIAKVDVLHNQYIESCNTAMALYERLMDEGVAYQDARFVLPEGICTDIQVAINFQALMALASKRLCRNMQWEIFFVVNEMCGLVDNVHPFLSKFLRPACFRTHRCNLRGESVFPPCGAQSEVSDSDLKVANDSDQNASLGIPWFWQKKDR